MVTHAEPLTYSGEGWVCDNGSKSVNDSTTHQSDRRKTRVVDLQDPDGDKRLNNKVRDRKEQQMFLLYLSGIVLLLQASHVSTVVLKPSLW